MRVSGDCGESASPEENAPDGCGRYAGGPGHSLYRHGSQGSTRQLSVRHFFCDGAGELWYDIFRKLTKRK